MLTADVNVVEVDLARAGSWRALLRPFACPAADVTTYRVTIHVPDEPGVFLHPIPLAASLPEIRVPLRSGEEPATLPLQTIFDEAYDDGRYGQTIDYARPLDPPLDDADAAWADALLRAAGRR